MARNVRPLGAGRALIARAIAALVVTASLAAQSDQTYDRLVDEYASGDARRAVAALATWRSPQVAGAAATRTRPMTPARLRAAVMLHTDTAYAFLLARGTADASTHLAAARRVLSALRSREPAGERTREFGARWFAFVASMYTAQGRLDDASAIVRDGFGLYPREARLYVARGSILEMNATLNAAEPRSGSLLPRNGRWFESAGADYLRAIALADTLAVAHLHLGWVRLVAGDDRSRGSFEAALERADDDRTRYLAHLFLARFAERQNRLDDARREYEAAAAAGPSYQTAYVALSRLEEALGHSARAQQLAHAYASLAARGEDPWWDYHLGGFDAATLEWLRREARTP